MLQALGENMKLLEIYECKNGHHFINSMTCCVCGEPIAKRLPYQEGDCISCKELCPGYAYGCNEPLPLKLEDFDE